MRRSAVAVAQSMSCLFYGPGTSTSKKRYQRGLIVRAFEQRHAVARQVDVETARFHSSRRCHREDRRARNRVVP